MYKIFIIFSFFLVLSTAVLSVEPSEQLSDPVLEARARAISKGIRCVVCRNENIDDSNAHIAKDLRVLVRERVLAGDSDDQVVDNLTSKYGEYILLKPSMSGGNIFLWLSGPILVLLGSVLLFRQFKQPNSTSSQLSVDDQKKLKEILKE